jgi:radical SAM superfamily enzyme YgiQ (UPF0313 family)
MDKKILLTTVYKNSKEERYDWFKSNTRVPFNFTVTRILSYGLRFIKQNIPGIEILEYPTWKEYVNVINKEKWDVVGFSFYLNEIHEILEMIKYARQAGVKEIWGGNYGALTEEVQEHLDKAFFGYSEEQIAKELGYKMGELIHPPLINYLGTTVGFKLQVFGVLFTSRGCAIGCDFCQTPVFCPRPYPVPLSSIEKVLNYLKSINIDEVVILDENFGLLKSHTEDVVNLLGDLGFQWYAMTKVNQLKKKLTHWIENGFGGAFIGIESMNQETLDSIGKGQTVQDCIDVIREMNKHNRLIVGYYMIGFENDTKESIKRDIAKVARLNLDVTQICVLTPLPRTKQWEYIDNKYGIFDKDWHHYNAKHLVWNHPHVEPVEMRKLLNWSFKTCYPWTRVFGVTMKFHKMYKEKENKGLLGGVRRFYTSSNKANKFDYFPKEIPLLPTT